MAGIKKLVGFPSVPSGFNWYKSPIIQSILSPIGPGKNSGVVVPILIGVYSSEYTLYRPP